MRSRRLATLERLAAMAERSTRLALARSNQEVQRRLAQQQQLEDYDLEYATRWLAAGRHGIDGRDLRRLGAFRDSLARTLDTQLAAVRKSRESLASDAGRWRGARERLRVYADLVGRARAAESRQAERRAQREVDDLSAGRRRGQ